MVKKGGKNEFSVIQPLLNVISQLCRKQETWNISEGHWFLQTMTGTRRPQCASKGICFAAQFGEINSLQFADVKITLKVMICVSNDNEEGKGR